MNWFKNLNLFSKILAIIGLSVALFVINIIININAINATQNELEKLETRIYSLVQVATVNDVLLKRADELLSQSVSFADEDLKVQAIEELNLLKANIKKAISLDSENKARLEKELKIIEKYKALSIEIVDGMLSGDIDFSTLPELAKKKSDLLKQANEDIEQYQKQVQELFLATIENANENGDQAIIFSLQSGVIMLSALVVMALYVARTISFTANKVGDSLQHLGDGDGNLNDRIEVQSNDEFGKMALNFNRFMDLLLRSVQGVMSVSQPLLDTSTRLITNTDKARVLTEQQAEFAEQAQQSMTDLQTSITDITDAANQANQAVTEAESEADTGLGVVEKTIANSQTLNDQIENTSKSVYQLAQDTENVASIVDVITSIAEQTNLLALNAAIEAARAGEQGRGFAVVADEVRTLASRTGEATTEIRDVLDKLKLAAGQSVDMMKESELLSSTNEEFALNTGGALKLVKEKVAAMAQMNNQIATASNDQTNLAANVVEIINDMYEAEKQIQTSFGSLDEVSRQLHQASDDLMEATSQFRL
ncbi:methyl-accepting chemotaxis protein [Catenovulum sp. SM1970]|uniref:methyl-accepting chemotaxis protein n=1 Tax=Marinifaba aquimaris TaxID=2741323 RepID=UPI00157417B0|nr:methyl-accepting chemotaxis protein [Marinifaba aquimaris]NTS78340.1 methyl-accepting chemotaxis protein [Marinifaba aquimaris]